MNRIPSLRPQGFSLIEVLITILLISVGILGMVAMQAKAISYTQDSVQRNAAAMLADELMEILRADSIRVLTAGGLPRSSSDYYNPTGSALPNAPSSCASLPDAPADRLGCWAERVKQTLPGADELMADDFHVCRSPSPGNCDSSKGSAIEIQLAWRVVAGACLDADSPSDSTTCHYRLRSEL